MPTQTEQVTTQVARLLAATTIQHDVANGAAGATVTTEAGQVRTVANAIATLMATVARGAWLTATAYVSKDLVTSSNVVYICVVGHTSGTFATDLAAGKWAVFSGPADEGNVASGFGRQRRRDTKANLAAFTGLAGELSVNTTNNSVHVHNGTRAGGVPTTGGLLHALGYGCIPGSNTFAAANKIAVAALFADISAAGGGTILFPDGDFYLNCSFTGTILNVPANTTIIMGKKTRIMVYNGGDTERWIVFRITSVSNVHIEGGEIVGELAALAGGNYGYGIYCSGTTANVTVRDTIVRTCYTDSFFIGTSGSNIWFDGVEAYASRRAGLSIVEGTRLTFTKCVFNDNDGLVAAENGVNIETEAATDVTDVLFDGCRFETNGVYGLYIHKGSGAGLPRRIVVKSCFFSANVSQAINLNSGWSHISVIDCVLANPTAGDNAAFADGTNLILRGNRILGGAKGLSIFRTSVGIVSENEISNTTDSAIAMVDDSTTKPTFNIIFRGNFIYNSGEHAMDIRGSHMHIEGNVIDICQKDGIRFGGSNSRCIGNTVFQSSQASNGWRGIADGGFGNIISGNIVRKGRHSCTGTAAGGGAATITLNGYAPTMNDILIGYLAKIISGTGVANEVRTISGWNGTTQVATVSANWTTAPDATTVYEILPLGTGFYAAYGIRVFSQKSLITGNNTALSGTTGNLTDSGSGNTVANNITA